MGSGVVGRCNVVWSGVGCSGLSGAALWIALAALVLVGLGGVVLGWFGFGWIGVGCGCMQGGVGRIGWCWLGRAGDGADFGGVVCSG